MVRKLIKICFQILQGTAALVKTYVAVWSQCWILIILVNLVLRSLKLYGLIFEIGRYLILKLNFFFVPSFHVLVTVIWHKFQAVFKLYDKDNTNQLNAFELREALHSAGYKLNNHILNVLVHRYGTKEGYITFDDFIMCAVRLKTMIGNTLVYYTGIGNLNFSVI